MADTPNILDTKGIYTLFGKIDMASAKEFCRWILERNFDDKPLENLTLVINSPGGELPGCFSIVDTMAGSKIPIRTVGLGEVCSAGFMIFIAGEKGERVLTPNTGILSHQYAWGSVGKHHELMAATKEFNHIFDRMLKHYKKHTGLSEEKIKKYLLPEKDVWLSSKEALALKICDKVKTL